MSDVQCIDWSDVEGAATALAGNWKKFECFCWHRRHGLDDADNWLVWYSSNRDSGLLDKSNEAAMANRLQKYNDGDDPDIVFERHDHFAVGYVDGFSIRVFHADGQITEAFSAFCELQTQLADYPILDEGDYGERELDATLQNYRSEVGSLRSELPEGWEIEVYRHFDATGKHRCTENRDDQGGWASRDTLIEALEALGVLRPDEK